MAGGYHTSIHDVSSDIDGEEGLVLVSLSRNTRSGFRVRTRWALPARGTGSKFEQA